MQHVSSFYFYSPDGKIFPYSVISRFYFTFVDKRKRFFVNLVEKWLINKNRQNPSA